MMQVPEWLLVVLACFSSVLVIFVAVISIQTVKHWWKVRKYQKLYHSTIKFAPGRNKSFLKGSFLGSYSFPPIAQPTTVQSGTPIIVPTFKMHSVPTSVKSQASSYQGKINPGTFERKRRALGASHYHSMDERIFRKAMQKAPYDRQIESPPMMASGWVNYTSRESAGSGAVSPCSTNEGYSIYTGEYTPVRMEHVDLGDAYSHSHFLPSGNENLESEPVISYDQELSPTDQLSNNQPAFLYFTLVYNSYAPELVITVKQATDLPSSNENSESSVNSYVNLCIVPEDFLWKRTRTVESDDNPVFEETFRIRDVLYHKLREYTICFYVMDVQPIVGERVIGKVLYPLSDLRAEHVLDMCKELSPP